jgi:hypothetical protein
MTRVGHDPMGSLLEDDIAWDLLNQHGRCLTVGERHAVSINLAVGEYRAAIHDILTATVREQEVLAPALARRLAGLLRVYDCGPTLRAPVRQAIRLAEDMRCLHDPATVHQRC